MGPGSTSDVHRRGAVRSGEELYVAAEALVLAGVPGVDLLAFHAQRYPGKAVGGDQGAIQDHVVHPLFPAAFQHLVYVWGMGGQDVDAFVQVAVSRGLRGAGVPGQAVHAAALTKPAQHQHGLAEGTQRPRALRGADPAAVRGQQPGQALHHVARDIEHGNIGDQREASGVPELDLGRPVPTRGFTSTRKRAADVRSRRAQADQPASRRSFR